MCWVNEVETWNRIFSSMTDADLTKEMEAMIEASEALDSSFLSEEECFREGVYVGAIIQELRLRKLNNKDNKD